MKKLILITILLSAACSSSKNAGFNSAKVNYVSSDGRETITLSSSDIGKNSEEAIFKAEKLAFQNLFFRGIANSPFNKPLVGINEQAQYKKYREYLDSFYATRMGTFIIYSNESVSKVKGGGKLARVDLTINMLALQKDLEENRVIKKFGL